GHIARRSGVRLELTLAAIPLATGVAEVAAQLGVDAGSFAATAGEDYELCACLPAAARGALEDTLTAGPPPTLGRPGVGRPPGAVFTASGGRASGYEHSV